MNSQPFTFEVFKTGIFNEVVKSVSSFDAEWWGSQSKRIRMMYDFGETVQSASETICVFAVGNEQSKGFGLSPLDPRICKSHKEVIHE